MILDLNSLKSLTLAKVLSDNLALKQVSNQNFQMHNFTRCASNSTIPKFNFSNSLIIPFE